MSDLIETVMAALEDAALEGVEVVEVVVYTCCCDDCSVEEAEAWVVQRDCGRSKDRPALMLILKETVE